MKYQIVLSVRAKDGNRAISEDLLPPVVALERESLLATLIAVISMVDGDEEVVSQLGIDDVFELSDKVEADIHNNKYKWRIQK